MGNMPVYNFNSKKHNTYKPINMDKFDGKYLPCARSEWERQFMQWLDINPSIVKWDSEPIAIQYFDPVRRKQRRYYPDFLIQVRDKEGKEKIFLTEIKPYKEVKPPRVSKNKSMKSVVHEAATYTTNIAKWKAADDFCKKHNWEFKILTEKELFVEKR